MSAAALSLVVIATTTGLFALFVAALQAKHFAARLGRAPGGLGVVLAQRAVGGVLLGAVPLGVLALGARDASALGLGGGTALGWAAAAALALVVAPVAAHGAKKPGMAARYPEVRRATFPAGVLLASALGWAVYLVGYELAFRGALLFPLVDAWGIPVALVVNTALYTVAHAHKPRAELLACLPMGFVFGGLALVADSAWPAVALHIAIAWASEASAIAAHPEMRFGAGPGDFAPARG